MCPRFDSASSPFNLHRHLHTLVDVLEQLLRSILHLRHLRVRRLEERLVVNEPLCTA